MLSDITVRIGSLIISVTRLMRELDSSVQADIHTHAEADLREKAYALVSAVRDLKLSWEYRPRLSMTIMVFEGHRCNIMFLEMVIRELVEFHAECYEHLHQAESPLAPTH